VGLLEFIFKLGILVKLSTQLLAKLLVIHFKGSCQLIRGLDHVNLPLLGEILLPWIIKLIFSILFFFLVNGGKALRRVALSQFEKLLGVKLLLDPGQHLVLLGNHDFGCYLDVLVFF
jgi:hypothetical protein